MTQPVDKFWTVKATTAGYLKSKYPDGNDSAAPPTWAVVPNFVQISSNFSVDVLQYLSGSFDSIQLAVATGTQVGSGWAISTHFLTYTQPGAGLLTVRLVANFGSTTANSNVFTIQSVATPTGDFLPPAPPIPWAISLNGLNQPVLVWKPSSDPSPTGALWSGMGDYRITRNGMLIVTQPTAFGTQVSLQHSSIGTPAIPGSAFYDPTSAVITMTAGGINYFDTADEGEFIGTPWTGDYWASCRVPSFTCSNANAKVMFDCRATLDPGSVHVACSLFPLANGAGFNLYYRTTQGSITTKNTVVPYPSGATQFFIGFLRTGNVFSFYGSVDGINFVLHSSVTVSMPAAVQLGIAGSAQIAGVTLSATVDMFNISNAGDQTYTDTTATPGVLGQYSITGRDAASPPNESASLGTISITPTAPPSGLIPKYYFDWHDGTTQGLIPTGDVSIVTTPSALVGGGSYVLRCLCNRKTSSIKKRAEVATNYNPNYNDPHWYTWRQWFDGTPSGVATGGWTQEGYINVWEIMRQWHSNNYAPSSPHAVISSITTGSTTTTFHCSVTGGFANPSAVTFFGMPGSWAILNNQTFNATVIDSLTFSVPLNSSGFGSYTGGGTAYDGLGNNPPFGFYYDLSDSNHGGPFPQLWRFQVLGDDRQPVPLPRPLAYQTNKIVVLGPTPTPGWHDISMLANWDYRQKINGGNGYNDIYLDGVHIPSPSGTTHTYDGQNCFNDTPVTLGPYDKAGQYRGWTDGSPSLVNDPLIQRIVNYGPLLCGRVADGYTFSNSYMANIIGPRPS